MYDTMNICVNFCPKRPQEWGFINFNNIKKFAVFVIYLNSSFKLVTVQLNGEERDVTADQESCVLACG